MCDFLLGIWRRRSGVGNQILLLGLRTFYLIDGTSATGSQVDPLRAAA